MFDVFEEGLTVIDFLAQMDVLSILNMPKIAKIAEQVWSGNYEQRKGQTLIQALKTSEIGQEYRDLDIDLDTMITVVGKRRCWLFFTYSSKIFGNSVKKMWQRESNSADDLLQKKPLTKTPRNSIFLQAHLESLGTLILVFCIFVIFILEIISRRNLRTTYSSITTLQSQTQTTSVLAQIETQYSNLKSYGDDWYIRFRALVILNSMMI